MINCNYHTLIWGTPNLYSTFGKLHVRWNFRKEIFENSLVLIQKVQNTTVLNSIFGAFESTNAYERAGLVGYSVVYKYAMAVFKFH